METKTKVHISKVNVKGPKVDKNGKNYFAVGILTRENGDKWFNCNYFPFNPDRWEGTEQEVILYDEEYQGKMYSKFKLPPRERTGGGMSPEQYQILMREVQAIKVNVLRILSVVDKQEETTSNGDPMPNFDPGPTDEDIDPRDIVPD